MLLQERDKVTCFMERITGRADTFIWVGLIVIIGRR